MNLFDTPGKHCGVTFYVRSRETGDTLQAEQLSETQYRVRRPFEGRFSAWVYTDSVRFAFLYKELNLP